MRRAAIDQGEKPVRPGGMSHYVRLPLSMADFARRGFRLDRPAERETLEGHAKFFLTGFNLAVVNWRDPHPALVTIPDEERGFAYEGAGMYAALRDLLTAGRSHALRILLGGAGDHYAHLVHVGYGWALAPLRIPLPVRLPATPLFRWLALDGAGFAETFFGGLAALGRRSAKRPTEAWEARVAGCGRALWFVQSADVAGVAKSIEQANAMARPHLWSGVGLAACYAGCADERVLDALVAASGSSVPYFAQGALFAAAARVRSGIVPKHTDAACRRLFSADPDEVSVWTDEAASGLTRSRELAAYTEWKSRLRAKAVPHF